MENKCVCCGADIPEGRQVCPNCESLSSKMQRYCKYQSCIICPYVKYGSPYCVIRLEKQKEEEEEVRNVNTGNAKCN